MEEQPNSTDDRAEPGLSREELAKLFNYPSIGQLFSDSSTERLDTFRARLDSSRENLERVVRFGNPDEAERAMKAARAVEVTLDFLQTLQKMRSARL